METSMHGRTKFAAAGLLAIIAGAAVFAIALPWQEELPSPGRVVESIAPAGAEASPPVATVVATRPACRPALRAPARRTRPEDAASTSGLRLSIVTESGSPVAGARVVLLRESAAAGQGSTNVAGLVEFADAEGASAVAILHPERPPHVAALAASTGDEQVTLPDGAVVEGRITIDGHDPGQTLRATLAPGADCPAACDVPDAVHEALGFRASSDRPLCGETDERGCFRFAGLPGGFAGRLIVPGMEFSDVSGRPASLEITAPGTGIVFDLRRRAALAGRLVKAGRRSPIAEADVICRFQGGKGPVMASQTDADGRFMVVLPPSASEAQIEIRVRGLAERKIIELPDCPASGRDLGDVEVAVPEALRLEVRDAAGTPVAGASARSTSSTAGPSGLDGRLDVAAESGETVLVEANGFLPATLVSTPGEDLRIVTLDGGAALALEVRAEEPTVLTGLAIRIAREDDGAGDVGRAFRSRAVHIDAAGRARITGLPSGVRLRLTIEDGLGIACIERLVAPCGLDEPAVIDLGRTVDSLAGTIRDARGGPIAGAQVRVRGGGGRVAATATDESGAFVFPAIAAAEADIEVRADGCETLCRRVRRGGPDPESNVIALAPAHEMFLEVVDASGIRVPADSVIVALAGTNIRWKGHARATGLYAFRGVPDGEMIVTVTAGGQTTTARHRAEAMVRVVVQGD